MNSQGKHSDADLEVVVQMVKNLPPLPEVAYEAMKILDDPYVTPGALGKLISQDTTLAARVLKVANSSMFGRSSGVQTLNDAIVLIGFKMLRGLILAAAMQKMSTSYGSASKIIWQNSVCTALIASEITKELHLAYFDESFTQGLLHDVGKIVMLSHNAGEYAKVLSGVSKGITFIYAEEIYLGYTHTRVGEVLARKWNFPLDICSAILHHHDPLPSGALDPSCVNVAIIKTADLVAYAIGMGRVEGYPDTAPEAKQCLNQLGIANDDAFIEKCNLLCARDEPLYS